MAEKESPHPYSASWIARVEETMVCALCRDVLRSPRLLDCCHTFCSTCILQLVLIRGGSTLSCPICRTETALTAQGIDGFRVNFALSEEILAEVRDVKRDDSCPRHPSSAAEFRCCDCQEVCCSQCLYRHRDHKVQTMSEAVPALVQELTDAKPALENMLDQLTQEEKRIHETRKLIRIREQTMLDQIQQQGDTLHSMIDQMARDKELELNRMFEKIVNPGEPQRGARSKESRGQGSEGKGPAEGSKEGGSKDEDSDDGGPSHEVMPGWICRIDSSMDRAIRQFLGEPVVEDITGLVETVPT